MAKRRKTRRRSSPKKTSALLKWALLGAAALALLWWWKRSHAPQLAGGASAPALSGKPLETFDFVVQTEAADYHQLVAMLGAKGWTGVAIDLDVSSFPGMQQGQGSFPGVQSDISNDADITWVTLEESPSMVVT